MLLNTDKGVYSIHMPNDSEYTRSNPDSIIQQYKFLLTYKDSVFNIKSGDSVIINQKDTRFQFDIINPYGNGPLKYVYKLYTDSAWHELNANELNIPSLLPDKYYKLFIVANDDSWRSNDIVLYLYIQPYWWQTNSGKKIIWLSAAFFIIIFYSATIGILTRLRKFVAFWVTKKEISTNGVRAKINVCSNKSTFYF